MSADETVAQTVTFLLAGTDTTSHTLAFVLYSLAMNPEVQSKLEREIRNCLENNKVSCHVVSLTLGGGYASDIYTTRTRVYWIFTPSVKPKDMHVR